MVVHEKQVDEDGVPFSGCSSLLLSRGSIWGPRNREADMDCVIITKFCDALYELCAAKLHFHQVF